MPDDHRCLRHETLRYDSNRKIPVAEILLPQIGEYLTRMRPLQFNRRTLTANIDDAEMMLILHPQWREALHRILYSDNQPPIRRET